MTGIQWLVIGMGVAYVAGGLMLSFVLDKRAVGRPSPPDLRLIARTIGRGRRGEWGRPQPGLGDFLEPTYYADSSAAPAAPPHVGSLRLWWFAGGEWEGVPAVRLALDGPEGQVSVEVLTSEPGKLRPGTMIPFHPATRDTQARAAVTATPVRIARAIADERLRRGLYDTTQHALVVDGVTTVVPVTRPWPTGRIRDGQVEVTVRATVGDQVVPCTGFVRPEDAAGMRLSRRAPVTLGAGGSTGTLGPFPW